MMVYLHSHLLDLVLLALEWEVLQCMCSCEMILVRRIWSGLCECKLLGVVDRSSLCRAMVLMLMS